MKKKFLLSLSIFFALSTQFQSVNAETTKQKEQAMSNPNDISQLAPEFNKLTQDLLNGDIWKRPPLSARDKSLVTITILVSLSRVEQLDVHLNKALDNGLNEQEIVAAMTHTAFYAGWPAAYTGITHLKKVLEERKSAVKK